MNAPSPLAQEPTNLQVQKMQLWTGFASAVAAWSALGILIYATFYRGRYRRAR